MSSLGDLLLAHAKSNKGDDYVESEKVSAKNEDSPNIDAAPIEKETSKDVTSISLSSHTNFPDRVEKNISNPIAEDDSQSNASSTDDFVRELLDPNDRPKNVWHTVEGPKHIDGEKQHECQANDPNDNADDSDGDYGPPLKSVSPNDQAHQVKLGESGTTSHYEQHENVFNKKPSSENNSDNDLRGDQSQPVSDLKHSKDSRHHGASRHGHPSSSSSRHDRHRGEGGGENGSTHEDRDRRRDRDRSDDRDRDGERRRHRSHRSHRRRDYSDSDDDNRRRYYDDDDDRYASKYSSRSRRSQSKTSSRRRDRSRSNSRSPTTKRNSRTISIMQLNPRVTSRDIEDFFSTVGRVKEVRLIMDSKTRRHKGIAYIEFEDTSSASKASALNGKDFFGAPIVIQSAQMDRYKSSGEWHSSSSHSVNNTATHSSSRSALPPNCYRVYVGGLHVNITEEMLRPVFEPFGTIVRFELMRDRATNMSRGYAFITYENIEDGQLAVQSLDGLELGGKTIRVGKSTDKNERGSGGLDGGHHGRNSGNHHDGENDSRSSRSRDVTSNLYELAGHHH